MILAVLLCMICCGRLAEMIYTAVIITVCEAALPACIYYSTISPFTVQYPYDIENFVTYCPAWSAISAKLMEFGYSTKVLLSLEAQFSQLCLSHFCISSTKSVTARTRASRSYSVPIVKLYLS